MPVAAVNFGNRKSIKPELAALVVVARLDIEFDAPAGIVNNKAGTISNGDNNNRFSIGVNLQVSICAVAQFNNPSSLASNSDWADLVKRLESLPQINSAEEAMDEEALNMSIRKFLKKVGITSQREIERALDQANQQGKLDGAPVRVTMTLECDLFDEALSVTDEIRY